MKISNKTVAIRILTIELIWFILDANNCNLKLLTSKIHYKNNELQKKQNPLNNLIK